MTVLTISNYKPVKPFENYKWFFATKVPTESLGDPAVLLGLTSRMACIADGVTKYNSDKFARILKDLDQDIKTPVDLSKRVGERNLMRNSGQYWRLFGLIPKFSTKGVVTLTPLGQAIADGSVNQIDFAACMIVSLTLPNSVSYTQQDIWEWQQHDLSIHPFKLILKVLRELNSINHSEGWLDIDELAYVVVPMAADKRKTPKDIADYVCRYRKDPNIVSGWPNCVPKANDKRFLGEYLRFLANFGYVSKVEVLDVDESLSHKVTRYVYINELDYQISELINGSWSENSQDLIKLIQSTDIASAVSMAFVSRGNARSNQQKFRHELLEKVGKCPITGNNLPSVLQAAHIKPHQFGGPEEADNGLPLRADIHVLFDAGLLSIKPLNLSNEYSKLCEIEIRNSDVRANYRELVNKYIMLPEITNMDYVKWRYQNALLGASA